jgi:hypothetical protein
LGLDPEDEASTIDVDTLFEWITMNRVRIDPRFRRMLNERKKQAGRQAHNSGSIVPRHIEKPLHGATWRVHARIVTAMAASKYDLRKENNIGRAAKAIQHDADLIGLGFDVATIRKLLRAGFEEYRSQNAAK